MASILSSRAYFSISLVSTFVSLLSSFSILLFIAIILSSRVPLLRSSRPSVSTIWSSKSSRVPAIPCLTLIVAVWVPSGRSGSIVNCRLFSGYKGFPSSSKSSLPFTRLSGQVASSRQVDSLDSLILTSVIAWSALISTSTS